MRLSVLLALALIAACSSKPEPEPAQTPTESATPPPKPEVSIPKAPHRGNVVPPPESVPPAPPRPEEVAAAPAGDAGPAPVVVEEEPPPQPEKPFEQTLAESKDLTAQQKYAEAEKLWSDFVMAAPNHKRANFELGRVLYLKGDLPGAKKQAEIACMQGWEDGCVQADLLKKELEAKKP